jgi:hypothetical protein
MKSLNKKKILLILATTISIALLAYFKLYYIQLDISDVYSIDIFTEDNTYTLILNSNEIDKFSSFISPYRFRNLHTNHVKLEADLPGYTFYLKGDKTVRFATLSKNFVMIDNDIYEVLDGGLDYEFIEKFITSNKLKAKSSNSTSNNRKIVK